jgi:hypothetical protein
VFITPAQAVSPLDIQDKFNRSFNAQSTDLDKSLEGSAQYLTPESRTAKRDELKASLWDAYASQYGADAVTAAVGERPTTEPKTYPMPVPKAIAELRSDPTLVEQFNKVYGPNAAAAYLKE